MDHETLGAALALAKKKLFNEEAFKDNIDDWLDDHPEATTTVQDGSITRAKLANDVGAVVDGAQQIVAVQPDQPTASMNKIWIDSDEFGETSIPTMEDLEEVADDVTQLSNALQDIDDEIFNKTLFEPSSASNGWKLVESGLCVPDSAYKMDKYQVQAGQTFYIVSDHLFQFQNSAGVPSGGTPNRIGDTYGVGEFTLVAPENATYLIVSTLSTGSTAAVYTVIGKIDAIVEDVGVLQTEASETASNVDKTKMYGMAVRDVIDGVHPQIVDLTGLIPQSQGTSYKYYNVSSISFTENGDYYPNPIGECSIIYFYVLNENGTRMKYNGTISDRFTVGSWDKITRVDNRHIERISYSGEANFKIGKESAKYNYEYPEDIAAIELFYLKNSAFNNPVDLGITYNFPSISYIPYGISPQYNPWMFDAVWNGFVSDNKFYDIPAKRLNPWMQRSYALTHNLLDDRKIDWVGSGNYYSMKYGQTVPVTGGRSVMCNKSMFTVKTYDIDGVETSLPNVGFWGELVLPNDAVAIRFDVWRGTGSNAIPVDEYFPVVLFYTDGGERLYPYDYGDGNVLPIPRAQINGWDINKNVYDYAVPDEDSEIVRMMKCFSIREINRKQDAFRIGTFNVYVNYNRTNRPIIKKELATYGIDMCCFQESRTRDSGHRLNLGDYLKGWQFGYCNTNEEDADNARSIVSAYQVLSSEAFVFESNSSNSFLKCVIQLPRYKDYYNGDTTLSLYTYHGIVSSAETRAAEVSEILAKIAEDTSDFIVVTGDTNDFSTNKDIWAMFNNAGLTPIHNGESSTVTAESPESIDNIFISEHITCLYYDVINSNEWSYTESAGGNPHAVSDHDFLFADLKFDFAAVLAARNANS